MTPVVPVRMTIGHVRISAQSGIDARRLADALPQALDKALKGALDKRPYTGTSMADAAARQIAEKIMAQVEAGR